ncbi:TetR/AcrR family transcriptional regulator [Rouxiella sp. WC2420]|uniref:TetR/AcrR family transcriptional regulator n=1 Tax=Rouxiella sp. WC2420 TaxID=3234145 RepID=A0AB39VM15_9GAMM
MRTGRPRQFDRDTAVQQAMHLFWQNGYESTSLAQLKAAMGQGITAPSFYAAFGSKEALFREAVSRYLASHGQVMEPLWDNSLSPVTAIELALRQSARMQCEKNHPQGCMVALGVMSACSPENQQVMQPLKDSRLRIRQGIKSCLQRAIECGELMATTDVAGLAALIDSFLLGISTLSRDGVTLAVIEGGISQAMNILEQNRA